MEGTRALRIYHYNNILSLYLPPTWCGARFDEPQLYCRIGERFIGCLMFILLWRVLFSHPQPRADIIYEDLCNWNGPCLSMLFYLLKNTPRAYRTRHFDYTRTRFAVLIFWQWHCYGSKSKIIIIIISLDRTECSRFINRVTHRDTPMDTSPLWATLNTFSQICIFIP